MNVAYVKKVLTAIHKVSSMLIPCSFTSMYLDSARIRAWIPCPNISCRLQHQALLLFVRWLVGPFGHSPRFEQFAEASVCGPTAVDCLFSSVYNDGLGGAWCTSVRSGRDQLEHTDWMYRSICSVVWNMSRQWCSGAGCQRDAATTCCCSRRWRRQRQGTRNGLNTREETILDVCGLIAVVKATQIRLSMVMIL